MKRTVLVLSTFLIGFVVSAQDIKKAEPVNATQEGKIEEKKQADATIDFEQKTIDYGVLEHNSKDDVRIFKFTNNGTEPLIIKNAKGSCGCTVPTWSREPIAPGDTSEIGVKYATNRVGKFTKTITLTTNASKKPVILTIKGEVNPAPKEVNAPEREKGGAPLEKK